MEEGGEGIDGGAEPGSVIESSGAAVDVPDAEATEGIPEAEVNGEVVLEETGVGEVKVGEDSGVNVGMEIVGAVQDPQREEGQ